MNEIKDLKSGRRRLLLIGLLFFAPIFVAITLYYYLPESWRPEGRTNQGHLLVPARPLEQASLRQADGRSLDAKLFQGRWTMLYIGGSGCDPECQNLLYLSRQVRTSLGGNMDRVQRVYVATDRAHLDKLQKFIGEMHPDMQLAIADDAGQFLEFFSLDGSLHPDRSRNIYLLDPLGNWLMYYTPQDPPMGMLKDLKKLLKLSSIG